MLDVVDCKVPMVPSLFESGARLMIVLAQDAVNKSKVAYQAIVKLDDVQDKTARQQMALRVAGSGKKLTFDEAHIHFPSLAKRHYQRV